MVPEESEPTKWQTDKSTKVCVAGCECRSHKPQRETYKPQEETSLADPEQRCYDSPKRASERGRLTNVSTVMRSRFCWVFTPPRHEGRESRMSYVDANLGSGGSFVIGPPSIGLRS